MLRWLFSITGFLFILLFTIRGMYQVLNLFLYQYSDIGKLFSCIFIGKIDGTSDSWSNIVESMQRSPGYVLDDILVVLVYFVFVHGIIGLYYAISTKFSIMNMLKEKGMIYLQIVSAAAGAIKLMVLMKTSEMKTVHMGLFWVIGVPMAILGTFHIANGFSNACVTFGISVSGRSKVVVKIIKWIIAVFSFIQLVFIFT